MPFSTLDDLQPAGQRVLVRVDLNLPMQDGKVTDATRIDRVLPTIHELAEGGAKVVLLSHLGRPDGKVVPKLTLRPVARALSERLGRPVAFAEDCVGQAAAAAVGRLRAGEVVLLENLRFHAEEEQNDPGFAERLAALGDLYVNDAFSAAHRAHASTEGLAHLRPAAAGRNMEAELKALEAALLMPQRPLAALVGGAKVSTKIALLGNLVRKVDRLIIGGGMANTFLFAKGIEVGRSLCERELADTAREIMAAAKAAGCRIVLPSDVVVAEKFEAHAPHQMVAVDAVPAGSMILDIGIESTRELDAELGACRTLVWNGPLGAFETPPFDFGTLAVARAAARLTSAGQLLSVAGGGDTVAALAQAGVVDQFSYVSTAGGAFLEWLEGKDLPGVKALQHA